MRRLEMCTLIVTLVAGVGCDEPATSKPAPPSKTTTTPAAAPTSPLGDAPLIERAATATLAWNVEPSGKTALAVNSATGEPIEDAKGTLRFVKLSDGSHHDVPLSAKSGVLTAQGPKLDPDLTEVKYTLTVAGKEIEGSLHLPHEGTEALVRGAPDDATATEAQKLAEQEGEVVRVGDASYELVADEDSGVLKVFPRSKAHEPQSIVLGLAGTTPVMVSLERREQPSLHFVALLPTDHRPTMTVAVKPVTGKTQVALVGLRRNRAHRIGDGTATGSLWSRKGWIDEAKELEDSPANAKAKMGDDQVAICHRPPGNPDNAETLQIGRSALEVHLAHGDTEGECDEAGDDAGDTKLAKDRPDDKPAAKGKPVDQLKPADEGNPADNAKGKPADKGKGNPADKGKGNPADIGKPADAGKGKPADTGKGKPADAAKGKPADKGKAPGGPVPTPAGE